MTIPGRPIGEDDLHAYVDGHLGAARRAEVEAYLSENRAEAERVAGWAAVNEALQAALARKLHEPIPPQLDIHRLAARAGVRRWGTGSVAAAVAFALAVGAGSGWTAHRLDTSNGVTVLAREALAAQQVVAPNLVQQTVWPDPGLAGRIAAPDLSGAGYAIQGRQSVVTDEGVATLVQYANGAGHRINLFIRPMRKRAMTTRMQEVDDAPGWAWATDGLGVSVIASTPSPGLRAIAEQIRQGLRI